MNHVVKRNHGVNYRVIESNRTTAFLFSAEIFLTISTRLKMETRKITTTKNLNNIIQPLLTDRYQVSMCYGYWKDGKHEDVAVFDLFFRKNPFRGEYTIFVGLEECLKYIEHFNFSDQDIKYLRELKGYAHIEDEFWTYLKNSNASSVKLYAIHEGSVCFPNLPLVRVEGPLGLLQLIETTLLNLVNYPSLVSTNAARYRMAANLGAMPNCRLLEFGLRRAQGPDGGLTASRSSYIGGFDATSNLLAGKEFGIPVSGTLGHAFIMSYFGSNKLDKEATAEHKFLSNKKTGIKENFTVCCLDIHGDFVTKNLIPRKASEENIHNGERSELKAFIAFASAFPDDFSALVDTYDVIKSGLVNFCIVAIALLKFGYIPKGIRIDSGDLAYLSRFARNMFNQVANAYNLEEFNDFEIVASNDISEATISSLSDQHHAITSMGIGTHLVTCQTQPALGCVYKLVEANCKPCMKLSSMPEKSTIPCKKSTFRLYGKDKTALLDLIIMHNEPSPQPGQRILCRHPFIAEKRCYATPTRVEPLLNLWWDGELVKQLPSLESIRNHCISSLDYLTEDIKRSLNPTPYKVSVSDNLFNFMNQLKVSLTPIGELS